ncbi:MAG: serine/threonine-protein phosphatase, partial [Deltaproteobacteria bacterium]|nr:serine/threonine-protein phosphatase [Deltaproteobacteria bacterium]
DGMGGHRAGEVASQLAVEVIQKYCRENRDAAARDILDRGINLSCKEIYERARDNSELAGMGTTVLAMLFQGEDAYIGQVGDSRAYLVSGESIWQLTEDHSLLNEELRAGRLAAGQVAQYQFKNVITRSVGYESQVTVDIYRRKIQAGDVFLLCTDGLSGLVEIGEICRELCVSGADGGLKNLVQLAIARGGDDNITALSCEVCPD